MIIANVNSIFNDNPLKLNFILRLTDLSIDISNVVVLLIMDKLNNTIIDGFVYFSILYNNHIFSYIYLKSSIGKILYLNVSIMMINI